MPACTPTVTFTASGTWTTAVASVKWPTVRAKSPTAGADHVPFPSGTPVASTCTPAGAVMVVVKSAAGVVAVSAWTTVGGSTAQPTPGSQDRIGKNEPSRTLSPVRLMRSPIGRGRVSVQGSETSTAWFGASWWGTTKVVGFGRDVPAGAPSTVTGPGSRWAPAPDSTGPLGQRR